MKTFTQFKESFNVRQKEQLVRHFDEIYVCKSLTNREFKMVFLAYL